MALQLDLTEIICEANVTGKRGDGFDSPVFFSLCRGCHRLGASAYRCGGIRGRLKIMSMYLKPLVA